ncbi:MAG: 5-oxoprolinase subunit PxpA [Clostridiales Family XIII bacterium]|jgi:UPF0271 protein|nr:5-oxoprolinase subunit PxpA [Clostridiales Family XIII bacterium]
MSGSTINASTIIDVNVDTGESFGRYTLGNDREIMKYVTSANVATCFHAGDPSVLEQTIIYAKEYGVAVGAHTGLPDKQGFGRREMDITAAELRADTLFQLGAIDGVLCVHGMTLQHIKPHGVLYRMVSEFEEYVDVFLDTVKEYNPDLYVMLPENTLGFKRGIDKGMKMAGEALIDLSYDDKGNWVLERNKKARSPDEVAARAVMVAKERQIETVSGRRLDMPMAVTVCIHGDGPNSVEIAETVMKSLKINGVIPGNLDKVFASKSASRR